jgi:hypothetical protein
MTEETRELRELEKKVGAFFYLLNAMENAAAQDNPADRVGREGWTLRTEGRR